MTEPVRPLEALIEVWRAKARWMRGTPGEPRTLRRIPEGRIMAIEECADELEAALLQAAAPPAPTAPNVVTVSPTDLLPVGEALERLRAQASRTMAGTGNRSAAYSLAAFIIEQVEHIESAVSDQIEAADKVIRAPPERVSEGKEQWTPHPFRADSTKEFCIDCGGRFCAPEHLEDIRETAARPAVEPREDD